MMAIGWALWLIRGNSLRMCRCKRCSIWNRRKECCAKCGGFELDFGGLGVVSDKKDKKKRNVKNLILINNETRLLYFSDQL